VIEVRDDLHGRIKRLALLNDLLIHQVANGVIADFFKDDARIKALIKSLHGGALQFDYRVRAWKRETYLKPAFSFTQFLHQYQ